MVQNPLVPLPESVAGIAIPQTALTHEAFAFVNAAAPQFLANHCLRTFVFGALLAQMHSLPRYDAEAAFCAAALHDLGLLTAYATAGQRFELDGADAAARWLTERGMSAERVARVWDAIALHSSAGIADRKAPEIAMVHFGIGLDVYGRGAQTLAPDCLAEVIAAFPRAGFKRGFRDLVADYCRRKPAAQLFTWTDNLARELGCTLDGSPLPTTSALLAAAPFAD